MNSLFPCFERKTVTCIVIRHQTVTIPRLPWQPSLHPLSASTLYSRRCSSNTPSPCAATGCNPLQTSRHCKIILNMTFVHKRVMGHVPHIPQRPHAVLECVIRFVLTLQHMCDVCECTPRSPVDDVHTAGVLLGCRCELKYPGIQLSVVIITAQKHMYTQLSRGGQVSLPHHHSRLHAAADSELQSASSVGKEHGLATHYRGSGVPSVS